MSSREWWWADRTGRPHEALAWHGSPSGGDVATVRRPIARVAVAMSATLLISCASEPSCTAPDADSPDCHDLTLDDVEYDEWRTVEKPSITQELGDGRRRAVYRPRGPGLSIDERASSAS